MSEPARNLTVPDEAETLREERDVLLDAAKRALSLLEAIGTGKWANTPAGDALRAAIAKAERT